MTDEDIADLQSRLAKIELRVHLLSDITVIAIALAIAVSAGELARNVVHGHGLTSFSVFLMTFILVVWSLRGQLGH
jgi:hypothetical protein